MIEINDTFKHTNNVTIKTIDDYKQIIITDNSNGRGFFSLFREVLDNISYYTNQPLKLKMISYFYGKGLKGDFNIWPYVFEDDVFFSYNGEPTIEMGDYGNFETFFNDKLALSNCNLVFDSLKIKESILDKINTFWNMHCLNQKVLGVHYRGTDIQNTIDSMNPKKFKKVTTPDYIEYIKKIHQDYDKIFLASDENRVVDLFKSVFGDKLVYYSSVRSDNDRFIILKMPDCATTCEEAFIDAYLLSKCNYLIYGISNVAYSVLIMNPNIKNINMDYIDNKELIENE